MAKHSRHTQEIQRKLNQHKGKKRQFTETVDILNKYKGKKSQFAEIVTILNKYNGTRVSEFDTKESIFIDTHVHSDDAACIAKNS